jgi:hypothetical protein
MAGRLVAVDASASTMANADCSGAVRGHGSACRRSAVRRRHFTHGASLVGLITFVPLGLATGPHLLAANRGTVTRAGGLVSLVRNLLVFGAQYGIAVDLFLHPEAHASVTVARHTVGRLRVSFRCRDDCVPISLPDRARCRTLNIGGELPCCHDGKVLMDARDDRRPLTLRYSAR